MNKKIYIVGASIAVAFLITGIMAFLFTGEKDVDLPVPRIMGSVFDLANQPIIGAPFMLYKKDKNSEECLYTSISNIKGNFEIPIPKAGIYHLVTILDKKRWELQSFKILPDSWYVKASFIYSGIIEREEVEENFDFLASAEDPHNTAPDHNDNNINKNDNNNKANSDTGILEGKIIVNKSLYSKYSSLKLMGKYSDNIVVNLKTEVINGRYKFKNLSPGPYKFEANLSNFPPIKDLEVFILAGQTSNMNLNFTKTPKAGKTGINVSITVIDASWTPQQGADVVIVHEGGGSQREGTTNENGEVIFNNISSGRYQVIASFTGVQGRCELKENFQAVQGRFISLVLRESN